MAYKKYNKGLISVAGCGGAGVNAVDWIIPDLEASRRRVYYESELNDLKKQLEKKYDNK